MAKSVAVMGAGGKMGFRVAKKLADAGYALRAVEVSDLGKARLAEAGIVAMPQAEALANVDVVVLALHRDEIRIHAGTKWEKDLYRETVGHRLFGDPNYFSERKIYTLDPLRTEGADALDVSDLPGVSKIVLRKFELAWPGAFKDSVIRKSEDVFTSAEERKTPAIPESGQLIAAELDFYFGDNPKPRKVSLRPPNILKLGRHCDATLVHRWLMQNGFVTLIVNGAGQRTEGNITHVCVPHLPPSS